MPNFGPLIVETNNLLSAHIVFYFIHSILLGMKYIQCVLFDQDSDL